MARRHKLSLLRRGRGLGDLWDHLARAYGERPCISLEASARPGLIDADVLTYTDVADAVARLCAALVDAGVTRGTRVAICGENRIDYALTLFATIRAGGTVIPLHHHLTGPEVERFMARSGASLLVADPPAAITSDRWRTLTAGADGELGERFRHAEAHPPHPLEPDDVVAILYTSGTTGEPKGAELTSRSLLGVARLAALAPNTSDELGVVGLPTAHVMGLSTLLCCALAGVKLHWFSRFDAGRVLDAIETLRASFFVGVPAMYAMLLEAGAEQRDLRCVRLWASGADAMPPHLLQRFRSMGCSLTSPRGEPLMSALFAEVYGMVELSGPAIARITPAIPLVNRYNAPLVEARQRVRARLLERWAFPDRLGELRDASFGLPIPPYRVRVLAEDGSEQPPGEVGELVVRGPGVLKGYDGDAAATNRTTRDGWLYTGDLASRSRLGRITFHARKKDVIKHGGFSVFPAEVETELLEHPDVTEVVVFGAPHPVKGEVPVAAVVATLDASALVDWCREHMAPYRAPRAIAVVESASIPRNDNGKVLKGELREVLLPRLQSDFPAAFGQ